MKVTIFSGCRVAIIIGSEGCWDFHFNIFFCSVFAISFPSQESLKTIYQSILTGHLTQGGFSSQIQKNIEKIVNVALELHQKVSTTFLPTAIKFHYIFNLRDLSNIFQVGS